MLLKARTAIDARSASSIAASAPRGLTSVICFASYLCSEEIAPAGHRLDDVMIAVGDGGTHITDAARERLVCHHGLRPDGRDDLFFCNQAPGVFDHIPEDREALRAQLYLSVCDVEGAPFEIQRAVLEAINHGATPEAKVPWRGSQDFSALSRQFHASFKTTKPAQH